MGEEENRTASRSFSRARFACELAECTVCPILTLKDSLDWSRSNRSLDLSVLISAQLAVTKKFLKEDNFSIAVYFYAFFSLTSRMQALAIATCSFILFHGQFLNVNLLSCQRG